MTNIDNKLHSGNQFISNDILEELQNKSIENGTFPTLTRKYHTIAGEFLGKGTIIAFEFKGIEGALKFIIATSIKAQEKMITENKENDYFKLLKRNKKGLKNLVEILKDGIENIDKMLNEWE